MLLNATSVGTLVKAQAAGISSTQQLEGRIITKPLGPGDFVEQSRALQQFPLGSYII